MDMNRDKLKALVLYVIWRTGDAQDFGVTKLNKVLWFSDARFYEAYGRSITGETYTRRKFGPVPDHIEGVLRELVIDGLISAPRSSAHFDFDVKKYDAYAPADTSMFSPDELGFIDWWIKHVAEDHTATSISEKSHDYGWKIVEDGQPLPLHAFLARRIRPPSKGDELDWAKGAAAELSLK